MFLARLLTLPFICACCMNAISSQLVSHKSQSWTKLSVADLAFSAKDIDMILLEQAELKSLTFCLQLCHDHPQCHSFDYNDQSRRCRLFPTDIDVNDPVMTISTPHSIIGSVQFKPEYFSTYGQPCSACMNSNYLICLNDTCQCPSQTFFDGSTCRSQKLLGQDCRREHECRMDLGYTCLPRQQCGRMYCIFSHMKQMIVFQSVRDLAQ